MDYSNRIQRITDRYNPNKNVLVERRLFESETSINNDVARYVFRAMKEVDSVYTEKTKEAGNAVRAHLSYIPNVSFRYQGSVMTDTHIKGVSDIDLLVICNKFQHTEIQKVRKEIETPTREYTYNELRKLLDFRNNFSKYQGNTISDLAELRLELETKLSNIYTKCDTSKPKSIKITNTHYNRDVDVVVSSWFHSFDYVLNGMPSDGLGINIFDKDNRTEIGPDYPFLSISRINERSSQTNGRLKRMIRFLKNLRSDSEKNIDLNSFEINALCYSIPIESYKNLQYQQLVGLLCQDIYTKIISGSINQVLSVVGDEYVFKNKTEKIEALKLLYSDTLQIYQDLQEQNRYTRFF